MDTASINPRDFIVRSEDYGIPQARHRVILLGIRKSLLPTAHRLLCPSEKRTVAFALKDLPALRSRLGKYDSPIKWRETVNELGVSLSKAAKANKDSLTTALKENAENVLDTLSIGSARVPRKISFKKTTDEYLNWVRSDDKKLNVWLQHEARSHMITDLGRYFYAATFNEKHNRSPKGHAEFALDGLAPAHANWTSGKFADRFRVQGHDKPSTTITSHISKDGHYFIHPDPLQCRSLTVREAARLQTFPDNYFFEGNRTQQYHQVGNAVPPLLANKIALLCLQIFDEANLDKRT